MSHAPNTEAPVWPAVEAGGHPASGMAGVEPTPARRLGSNAEQQARIAARRALVTLKQSFMRAVDELSGPDAEWLHRKVRQANDSTELWRLRPTIFALLPEGEARSALHRNELNRQLDSVFPESSAIDSVPPVGGLAGIPPQLRPR